MSEIDFDNLYCFPCERYVHVEEGCAHHPAWNTDSSQASTRDKYVRLPDDVELCDSPWQYAVDVTDEIVALQAERDELLEAICSWRVACEPGNAESYSAAYGRLANIADTIEIEADDA